MYYSSDQSKNFEHDYDCFDYHENYVANFHIEIFSHKENQQIIPFCRRDSIHNELIIPNSRFSSFTFEELKERDVTSFDLYKWYAPIDLIEHYQEFREGRINTSSLKFYNCSSVNRFGSFCQYYIHYTGFLQVSFNEIVTVQLKAQQKLVTNGACYVHLNCTRNDYSWCLHWSHICDRKVDCWPEPIDEEHCSELENKECSTGEYRCRNGQCIPQEYYMDNIMDPDCLDNTDESIHIECNRGDPSIRCSDRKYRTNNAGYFSDTSCTEPIYCPYSLHTQFYKYLLARKNNPHLSDECWSTMICMIDISPILFLDDSAHGHLYNGSCKNICLNNTNCKRRMERYCPSLFEFPAEPIAWHDVHLLFSPDQIDPLEGLPDYVCFNKQSSDHWNSTMTIVKTTNSTIQLFCQPFKNVTKTILKTPFIRLLDGIRSIFEPISALSKMETENNCLEATQFQCGKRCLSRHRLVDRQRDCFDFSDEYYTNSCSLNDNYRIFCKNIRWTSKDNVCILEVYMDRDSLITLCDNTIRKQIAHFPTLCDGYIEKTVLINGQIETDEMNCEAWLCDNQYTRCDGKWNCLNGQDEAGCSYSYCGTRKEHPCLLWNTSQPICLPISYAGDGIVDCIGATDERHLCRDLVHPNTDQTGKYRCWNNRSINSQAARNLEESDCIDTEQLCDNESTCLLKDDESLHMCQNHSEFPFGSDSRLCKWDGRPSLFLYCLLNDDYAQYTQFDLHIHARFFHLSDFSFRPFKPIVTDQPPVSRTIQVDNIIDDDTKFSDSFQYQTDLKTYPCHGGILVYIFPNESSLSSSITEKRCFCSPAFYGKHCQYSSQRVTVTLEILVFEGDISFSFVIYLVDNHTDTVQSYHTINYFSVRDCRTKFGFHLLYATRPKATNRFYSVRIDAFETQKLKYRASWIYPVIYSFLPVYRLSILLAVPVEQPTSDQSCPLQCSLLHGECAMYSNTNEFFCRCKPGWFGRRCTQSFQCDCSSELSCVGTWNNRSICVCPLNRFGPRCYLTNHVCDTNSARKCHNGGQCIANDIRLQNAPSAICMCSEQFYGETCQINRTHINITFDLPNKYIPTFIFLHFITVQSRPGGNYIITARNWGPHVRLSSFKKIPIDSNSVTIYWNNEFHLLFAEYEQNIYLLILQKEYQTRINYNATIKSNQRCPSIRELLNTTIVSFPSFRRVKYYHIPCQSNLNLSCFHDEDQYLCLCTHDHRANCMEFDHHMKYNCRNMTYCENGGECFQNNATCPTAVICSCPTCYFGTRCQLTTQGFGLPLDAILGYQIWPNHSFVNQPLALQISACLTIVMFILGIINATLSILTFRIKRTRIYGCGIYLYTASIMSLLTIIIFTLKFSLLVFTQLTMIKSHLFLTIQCYSIDFLLKVSLQIGEWLYACVSMERLFTSIKATKFNKNLSRIMAKWMIIGIFIFVCGTSIHEAYYRRVLNDLEDNRTWCIVRYPKSSLSLLTTYTTVMTIIHFMGPFLINIISSIGNILITTKYRTKADKQRTYLTHFRHQLQLLKHSIISPFVLILFATPRIILAFTLECMKSAREPVGLLLLAYFVSFIPPIFTFPVFVLPSRDYRKAFQISTKACCCKR